VSWAGQDNPGGSGVAGFDIYVSDNGGTFVPFLTSTASTSATFNGQRGHTYAFYSIATDAIGNREATPAAAEAVTTVPLSVSTTTTLASGAPAGSTYGQSVTFIADVSANLAVFGTPTGSVQFQVDGVNLGTPVVLTNGAASITTSALAAGQHSITAIYTSDTTDFDGSTGGPLGQNVGQAALLVTVDDQSKVYGAALPTLTGTVTGLLNNDNITATFSTLATSASGVGTYAILATLNDPNGLLPNYAAIIRPGNLTVTPAVLTVTANDAARVYGAANPTFTYTITGFVNGDGAGVVTGTAGLTTAATPASGPGTYAIVAAQDSLSSANYTFAFVNGTLTVTQAPSGTTLVCSADPSVYAQPVTFTATVANLSGAGTPSGTVTFMDGTTTLATVALVAGQASYTTTTLARGSHAVTAVYSGDSNFLAGTSAVLTQQVETAVLEPDPLHPGQTALFVGGTSGNDRIDIESEDHGRLIEVEVHERGRHHFTFEASYLASSIDRIFVFGGPGNDVIKVSHRMTVPVLLFGGSGDNFLRRGSGPNVLVGATDEPRSWAVWAETS
jgi:hypothetical protein